MTFLLIAANFWKISASRQLVADGSAAKGAERARRRRTSLADYRSSISSQRVRPSAHASACFGPTGSRGKGYEPRRAYSALRRVFGRFGCVRRPMWS